MACRLKVMSASITEIHVSDSSVTGNNHSIHLCEVPELLPFKQKILKLDGTRDKRNEIF